jgi:hypothetical protein
MERFSRTKTNQQSRKGTSCQLAIGLSVVIFSSGFRCFGQAPKPKPTRPPISIQSEGNDNIIVGVNNGTINVNKNGFGYPGDAAGQMIRGSVAQVRLILDPSSQVPETLAKIPADLAGLKKGGLLIGNAVLINNDDFLTSGGVGDYVIEAERRLKNLGIKAYTMIGLVSANGEDEVATTYYDIQFMSVREEILFGGSDLAILRTDNAVGLSTGLNGHTNSFEHSPFRLATMELAGGEDILSCGFPDGTNMNFTRGTVTSDSDFQSFGSKDFKVYKVQLIDYAGYIAGGPLIRKSDHALIGILVGRDGNVGPATAIPAKQIEAVLSFNKIKWTGLKDTSSPSSPEQ